MIHENQSRPKVQEKLQEFRYNKELSPEETATLINTLKDKYLLLPWNNSLSETHYSNWGYSCY